MTSLGSNGFAEEVAQVILQKGDWNSVVLNQHKGTGKSACVAYVNSKDQSARLEVYAEKSDVQDYVAPTVQVSMNGAESRVGGVLDFGRSLGSFSMSISLRENQNLTSTYLATLQDRSKIVSNLIAGSSVKLNLLQKSQSPKSTEFSLKGSEAVIKKMLEVCKLSVGLEI